LVIKLKKNRKTVNEPHFTLQRTKNNSLALKPKTSPSQIAESKPLNHKKKACVSTNQKSKKALP
jgi:hypothetical protein